MGGIGIWDWDEILANGMGLRLLAETFLITAETYTENAETILNHIKNPAETLPKCQNPHLPKLPKPCQNYSKHIRYSKILPKFIAGFWRGFGKQP
ncbi:unnamed protein product [Rhizophagus irregularis]|nr:unnamed protein product [Rhizophagus irregularis]